MTIVQISPLRPYTHLNFLHRMCIAVKDNVVCQKTPSASSYRQNRVGWLKRAKWHITVRAKSEQAQKDRRTTSLLLSAQLIKP